MLDCWSSFKKIHFIIVFFFSPAQLVVRFLTLSDFLDKPRSQVPSLPPRSVFLHFNRAQGLAFSRF